MTGSFDPFFAEAGRKACTGILRPSCAVTSLVLTSSGGRLLIDGRGSFRRGVTSAVLVSTSKRSVGALGVDQVTTKLCPSSEKSEGKPVPIGNLISPAEARVRPSIRRMSEWFPAET